MSSSDITSGKGGRVYRGCEYCSTFLWARRRRSVSYCYIASVTPYIFFNSQQFSFAERAKIYNPDIKCSCNRTIQTVSVNIKQKIRFSAIVKFLKEPEVQIVKFSGHGKIYLNVDRGMFWGFARILCYHINVIKGILTEYIEGHMTLHDLITQALSILT